MRLLFVCLGNICRSPTAEGAMRALVLEQGLAQEIELDSAGTGSWHVGSPPDPRAASAARERGVVLQGRARQVAAEDFVRCDLILAMDRSNLRDLRELAAGEEQRAKVRLLREFDPALVGDGEGADPGTRAGARLGARLGARVAEGRGQELDVPDPYYGAAGGFEEVFDLVQAACRELLGQIRAGRLP